VSGALMLPRLRLWCLYVNVSTRSLAIFAKAVGIPITTLICGNRPSGIRHHRRRPKRTARSRRSRRVGMAASMDFGVVSPS
jgi:hypothetical protein